MNKLKSLRWPAALLVIAALAFYFGHHCATTQHSKTFAAVHASHASTLIDLLKTGQTEEAIRIETAYLNLMLHYSQQDLSLDHPLRILYPDPYGMRDSAMRSARFLRRNHPDVAFDDKALAQLEAFERRSPWPH